MNSETQEKARQLLRERALDRAPGLPITPVICRALAEGVIPLNLAYAINSWSITEPGIYTRNMSALLDVLARMKGQSRGAPGLLPLDDTETRLLSGWGMHKRALDNINYYINAIEQKIFEENIESNAKNRHGAILLDVGTGTGQTFRNRMEQLIRQGCVPKAIYLNDMVESALDEAYDLIADLMNGYGLQKTGNKGIPTKKIPGNILEKSFWDKVRALPLADSDRLIITFDGGTFNDLTFEHMSLLLQRFEMCKPGTIIEIFIDHTKNKQTLINGYFYPEVQQWLVASFVLGCWAAKFNVDPTCIGCRMDYQSNEEKDFVRLQHNITNSREQELLLIHKTNIKPVAPNTKTKSFTVKIPYILPVGDMPYESLHKIGENFFRNLLATRQLSVIGNHPVSLMRREERFEHVEHYLWRLQRMGNAFTP